MINEKDLTGKNEEKIIFKEINAKQIIGKSNLPACEFAVNPYTGCAHACRYCYACFMKRFTGHEEKWGTFVDIKNWDAIKDPQKYNGKDVFFGSVTDPYQPCEEVYQRTRAVLEQLSGSGAKILITTKSDLVLRDLELIKSFPDARVSWSVNTLDEKFKDDMDRAVSIERRLEAMKKFHEAGVITVCFISPIFPGLTDVEAIIERVKDKCNLIWLENLNLRDPFKYDILRYIKTSYPHLYPLYRQMYYYGNESFWQELDLKLRDYAKNNGFEYRTNDDSFSLSSNDKPVIVNFFYHSKIKKSAGK